MTWRIDLRCPVCDSPTEQRNTPDHATSPALIDCTNCGTQYEARVTIRRLSGLRLAETVTAPDTSAPGWQLIELLMREGQ